MKNLDPGLKAHLETGATTLCHCWKLTRGDGAVLGFTDHDLPVEFAGTRYEAEGGFGASELETSEGLSVDNLDVMGALNSERLREGDLAAGLYDDAEIEIWRVNWQVPSERVLLRKGNLGEVRRSGQRFNAEVRGLAHKLNQPVGRIYQYACDAVLGDSACNVDLTAAAFKGAGTVLAAEEARVIEASGLSGFAEGWFARGVLTFQSGLNAGRSGEVKLHVLRADRAVIELWVPMPGPAAPGDTFTVTAGCDKQFETCRAKFANTDNFRGFPHMPGNTYVQAYARRGERNDGGRL